MTEWGRHFLGETPFGGDARLVLTTGVFVSDPSNQVTVEVENDLWLVKDVQVKDHIELDMEGDSWDIEEDIDQARFRPLMEDKPIITQGPMRGYTGTISPGFVGKEDFDKFREIVRRRKTVLLQTPYEEQYYVEFRGGLRRQIHNLHDLYTSVTVDFEEVSIPD